MLRRRNFFKLVVVALVVIVLFASPNHSSVSAAPPLQSGSSGEAGPGGSGALGVAVSTQDTLPFRVAVPDQRPFKVGHQVSETEFAQLKQQTRAHSPARQTNRSPQQDPAISASAFSPLAPTPLSNNWKAIGPTIYEPPDPVVAASVDHVITVVNSSWAIYNKSGTQLYTSTLDSWFAPLALPGGTSIYDPRVLYDQHSSRWVLTALAFNAGSSKSWWLITVSQTASAVGSWWLYAADAKLDGSTPTTNFADYPGLGVDNQALYLSANMYSFSAYVFQYAKIRIVNKASLYSGSGLSWWDFWNLKNPDATQAFSIIPTHTFGAPGVEYLVNAYSANGSSLTLWALQNPLGAPSISKSSIYVGNYVLPPDADQPGTTNLIATNDARLLNAVYSMGSVWTAHSVAYDWGAGTRSALGWYQIDPILSDLWNGGIFGGTYLHYYFPAIMADALGNAAIVFSRSGTSEYASIRYTGLLTTDWWLQASAQLKAGEATYTTTYRRWGDYAGIALDPNGQWFWMFDEYAATGGSWATWVGAATFGSVSACYSLAAAAYPGNNGTLSVSPAPNCNSGTQYLAGTPVQLTANPKSSSVFQSWGGDASGGNPTWITMNRNKSVKLNFSIAPVTIYFPFLTKAHQAPPPATIALYVNNMTGKDMTLEVIGSGNGQKVMPSNATTLYGSFPTGTYTWQAYVFCKPSGELIVRTELFSADRTMQATCE